MKDLKETMDKVLKETLPKTIFHQTMNILSLAQNPESDPEQLNKLMNEHFQFIYHYVPKFYPEVMDGYTAIHQVDTKNGKLNNN